MKKAIIVTLMIIITLCFSSFASAVTIDDKYGNPLTFEIFTPWQVFWASITDFSVTPIPGQGMPGDDIGVNFVIETSCSPGDTVDHADVIIFINGDVEDRQTISLLFSCESPIRGAMTWTVPSHMTSGDVVKLKVVLFDQEGMQIGSDFTNFQIGAECTLTEYCDASWEYYTAISHGDRYIKNCYDLDPDDCTLIPGADGTSVETRCDSNYVCEGTDDDECPGYEDCVSDSVPPPAPIGDCLTREENEPTVKKIFTCNDRTYEDVCGSSDTVIDFYYDAGTGGVGSGNTWCPSIWAGSICSDGACVESAPPPEGPPLPEEPPEIPADATIELCQIGCEPDGPTGTFGDDSSFSSMCKTDGGWCFDAPGFADYFCTPRDFDGKEVSQSSFPNLNIDTCMEIFTGEPEAEEEEEEEADSDDAEEEAESDDAEEEAESDDGADDAEEEEEEEAVISGCGEPCKHPESLGGDDSGKENEDCEGDLICFDIPGIWGDGNCQPEGFDKKIYMEFSGEDRDKIDEGACATISKDGESATVSEEETEEADKKEACTTKALLVSDLEEEVYNPTQQEVQNANCKTSEDCCQIEGTKVGCIRAKNFKDEFGIDITIGTWKGFKQWFTADYGVCVAGVPEKPNLCDQLSKLAALEITGDECTDGGIILVGGIVLVILIFNFAMSAGRKR